jgi:hypothetical protein
MKFCFPPLKIHFQLDKRLGVAFAPPHQTKTRKSQTSHKRALEATIRKTQIRIDRVNNYVSNTLEALFGVRNS